MKLQLLCVAICCLIFDAAPAAESTSSIDGKTNHSESKPVLEKGMSAERIVELIGKPAEIKPMETNKEMAGRAETWIYRRPMKKRTIQVPVGTRDVQVFAGIGQGDANMMKTMKEPVYSNKYVTEFQVTSLLLVDSHLVIARQTREELETFD
ncbi:MAG TPA: hypothetical protein VGM64_09835 [Lacunisphaera sp.]